VAARLTDDSASERLKISEIFFSIQGEAQFSGLPTTFVRLTGCPLRCGYCDTAYAFSGGQWKSIEDILKDVGNNTTPYVCVTGGEPLAQSRCLVLLTALCDAGYQVSLETSGALDISEVDARVSRVMDIKTPASGESNRNRWENIELLNARDALKLVICNRTDYDWAADVVAEKLQVPCPVFFSPSYDELPAETLAGWILEDKLPVRLQVQLHKVLWGDVAGH
jgi:7-carboxy-7-deazaguanine synthase